MRFLVPVLLAIAFLFVAPSSYAADVPGFHGDRGFHGSPGFGVGAAGIPSPGPLPRRLSALEPCEYDPDECKYTATFLTVMGSGALLAGTGGLVAGILLTRNNQALEGDSTIELERKEGIRGTARQVIVIGALAATVGTGLLLGGIAEWARWRKYRPRVQARTMRFAVWASPVGGGATLQGRF